MSASRIRKCVITLRLIMGAALGDGMIARNPAIGVKVPRLERREAAYFEPAVVDKIAAAMPTDEYRLLVGILGTVGPRFGELAALRRHDVDTLHRRLRLRESVTKSPAGSSGRAPRPTSSAASRSPRAWRMR